MTSGDELMRHWPVLLSYVRRRLPDADLSVCEDIAADTIAKALTKYRERGSDHGLRRWLMTVARNAIIDWRRLKARTELPLLHVDIRHGRLDAGSDLHADVLDVRAALGRVNPVYRHQIERYRDGYAPAEVAAEMGRSYKATKSGRCRAMQALRGEMAS